LPERGTPKAGDAIEAEDDQETATGTDKSGEAKDDDSAETKGIGVRAVWPDSPADRAGVKPGDRITELGGEEVDSVANALEQVNAKSPGDELVVKFTRGAEEIDRRIELSELPVEVLSSSDLPDSAEVADDEDELKLVELKLPEMPQTARYYAPPGDGAAGLLVWLGDGKEESAKAIAGAWQHTCRRDRLILLMPEPGNAASWSNEDLEHLGRLLQTAVRRLDVDPQRIVVAGQGKAGQLAYGLAFGGRRLIRGVAVIDSPLPRTLELPDNSPNERLAILSVETQNTPLSLLMRKDRQRLEKAGYPATEVVRRDEASPQEPIDSATRGKIARWIDGLDRF
jgi:hypothetical protein